MLRIFWSFLFAFALLVVAFATYHAYRAYYEDRPVFEQLGLDGDIETNGDVLVGVDARRPGEIKLPVTAKIRRIDGQAVPDGALIAELADRLRAAPGPVVAITLEQPGGKLVEIKQERRPIQVTAETRSSDWRMVTRLGFALFACLVLLVCSFLLAMRQPNDPAAMMFAIIFALLAASADPAVQMWLWTGRGWVEDVLASSWFYLLLIALAAFPDGVFVPRFLRWMFVAAIPLVVFAALPDVDGTVQVLAAVIPLLALLLGQLTRYRRLPPGIERQQIKWAAFGFASGFVTLAASFILMAFVLSNPTQHSPLLNLVVLVLFSLGIALIPLGLLVALTRFRLWEADTVISRSAAYAVVTIVVGVVWAASSDLVKLVITEVMGRESEAGATTVGAIIAAGVFSPTQSAVLGWTRRHFGSPLERIKGAAERLKSWGLTETPAELATRALAIIDEAIHPAAAAILLDTPKGEQTIATLSAEGTTSPKLIESLALADEEGSVGTLRLGRRSDGNRYNRQELEAVRELIPHIADALRVASGRHSRESMLQQQIEAMAARLSQLEGGAPRTA